MSEHIVSSYDNELQDLRRSISEMGGIAEKMLVECDRRRSCAATRRWPRP